MGKVTGRGEWHLLLNGVVDLFAPKAELAKKVYLEIFEGSVYVPGTPPRPEAVVGSAQVSKAGDVLRGGFFLCRNGIVSVFAPEATVSNAS